jgi:uncharacterized membrane protein YhhN
MPFPILYALLIIVDLWAVSQRLDGQTTTLELFVKPLLMLSLGVFYYQNSTITEGGKKRNCVLLALAFSWLGDVLLLFKGYFVFGLAAFLVAHIFYILVFNLENPLKNALNSKHLWAKALIAVYSVGLLSYLLPNLPNDLKIPVVAYALTISTMLVAALNRVDFVEKSSAQWVLVGAILFVLSDSMIAISQFITRFPLSGEAIMLTYAMGQFLIVKVLSEK